MARLIINPFYAITIDENLCDEHEPPMSEDDWVAANSRILAEFGPEKYLRLLLDVLKGNYLVSAD